MVKKRIQSGSKYCGQYFFSGQVVGETARTLSERFGKVLQKRQSVSINRQDVSTSINTQLDSLIPASKIANLSQGTFVGAVSDNFGEKNRTEDIPRRNHRGPRKSQRGREELQKNTRHQ